jgi:hypothetical protein
MDVGADTELFIEAAAADIRMSVVTGHKLFLSERAGHVFRFFLVFTSNTADMPRLVRLACAIFSLVGSALHPSDRGGNVFYKHLDTRTMRCVVLCNGGGELRLVFPDVIVNSSRALQLRRHILEKLEELDADQKDCIFRTGRLDACRSVPNSERWESACPSHAYSEASVGLAMAGTTYATRCLANTQRKGAHDACEACSGSGFVPNLGRVSVVAVLVDARAPREERTDLERAEADCAHSLRISMLRTTEPLTEPYHVPSYAPVVPMQIDRRGRSVPAECFECEKKAFCGTRSKRQEYDLSPTKLKDLALIQGVLSACRGMHHAYASIGIQKMYKTASAQPAVYVHAEGPNATFCMNKQRQHRGEGVCRATFVLREANGGGVVEQQCFSPECQDARGKRYCSNVQQLPARLCEQLGFAVRGGRDVTADVWLNECAVRLDRQRRGLPVGPIHSEKDGGKRFRPY